MRCNTRARVLQRWARVIAVLTACCTAPWASPAAHAAEPSSDGLMAVFRALEARRPWLGQPTFGAGSVTLRRDGTRLRATVAGELTVAGPLPAEVPLLAAVGEVVRVTAGSNSADFRVHGGLVLLHVAEGQDRRIAYSVELALAVHDDAAVAVPLPPWPSASLQQEGDDVTVAGVNAEGQIPAGVRALLVRTSDEDAPRVRAARYRLALGRGRADVELRLEVEVRGGRGLVALAPKSVALVDVQVDGRPVAPVSDEDGEHHAVEVSGRGMRSVVARLLVATEGDEEDQRVAIGRAEAPITEVEVRVAGKRTLRFEPEVPLQTAVVAGQTVARAFLPPGETLEVGFSGDGETAVERTVRFSSETWQIVTLDEGLIRGQVHVTMAIVQGKANALLLAIPDEAVVAQVEGDGVTTWDVLGAAGDLPRRVRVGLSGAEGTQQVTVKFERPVATTAGAAVEVPVLRPLGAFRESGAVVLLDGDKVGFAAIEGATGWLRAGLEALPAEVRQKLDGRADQVWRHIGAPAKLPAKFAAARVREVRLEARSTALARFDERSLRASHVVVVEVKAGRADRLVLDLPEGVGEPRVVAPNLSKVQAATDVQPDKGRKLWELRFSTALEGAIQLQIDLEQLIAADVKEIALPDVRLRGAEVETGVLALSAEAGLELTPSGQGETRPVPTTELPEALAQQAGRDLVAGFRSPRGAVQVQVALQRRATVATLDAFAHKVWVETHLLEDGRLAGRLRADIRSQGRPMLRIALDKAAEILSLTVGGEHVKAVRDESGAVAVPLGGAAKTLVELRYEVRGDEPGLLRTWQLRAPALDVRQSGLAWRLRLPGDRGVWRAATTLRQDADWSDAPEDPGADGRLVALAEPNEAWTLWYSTAVRDANAEAAVALTLGPVLPEWLLLLAALAAVIGGIVWLARRRRKVIPPPPDPWASQPPSGEDVP